MSQTAPTRRRSARGWGARLAAFLSTLGFAFAVAIAVIQDYSYEIAPSFSDGVDDDDTVTVPFLWMLENDGMKDSSKQRVLIASAEHLIGSKSVARLSAAAKSPRLTFRNQYRLPMKRPLLAERRASKTSAIDPD